MGEIKRKWDVLTKEKRQTRINEIITYFETEHEQTIGVIAAGGILDFFLQTLGEDIYHQAISDCKKTIKEKIETIEIDLDQLINK